jgi:phosphatidate cytidylyltransferase
MSEDESGETGGTSRAVRGLARARRIGGTPASPPTPDRFPPDVVAETDDSATTSGGKPSRAGRNLPAAIGVGLGLGAVIVVSLFVYRPSFGFVVGAAVLYGLWEITRAIGTTGVHPPLPPLLVGAAAALVAAWQRGPDGLVVAVLLTACAVLIWRIGDGAQGYLRDVGAALFVLLYVPLLAGFAILLAHPSDGAGRVLAFIATVVCSDTGGYATGVLFGKHPLAPIVSKAKTWEGFAGSVIACSTAGILFLTLTFHEAWWKGLLFGLAIVVTATIGDLGESLVKRDLGVKDMGTLLPGHGGVMDRLDSLLPCAAVAYLLLSAFAPT